jgi:hypothetical protein
MKPISDNYWRNLGIILLIAALIMLAITQCAAAGDLVTYETTADGNGNLTTYGSDGSVAESSKCQTCSRPSYDTVYKVGGKRVATGTTEQNGTNDDWTTTVRKSR